MDIAHKLTDKIIAEAEKKIAREYRAAGSGIRRKADAYFAQFAKEADAKIKAVNAGAMTMEEYKHFFIRKTLNGKQWVALQDTLAHDYHNVNMIARKIYRDSMIDAYALNHNFAVYEIEHGAKIATQFTLYDHTTVERLLKDNPKLFHDPGVETARRIAENPDLKWNREQVQSSILQSILQGESIEKAATRLESVTERNHHAAVRNARTAITGAQNAGRQQVYEEAEEMGIDCMKTWEATLDNRTRHEHRALHGQSVPVDQPFEVDGYEIMYPGDPDADAEMVYNCRCTMTTRIIGYERDMVTESPKMGGLSFEEWRNVKTNGS